MDKYSEHKNVQQALDVAFNCSQFDGSHHKEWAIDQMVRKLLGDKYTQFIAEYENNGEYEWSVGIPP